MAFVSWRARVAALAFFWSAVPCSGALSVKSVRESPTLRVRGGPAQAPLPLELVNFLLDHPDMTAWFARERGVARYSIERKSVKEYAADDHQGARGRVRLLERAERARLYYGEGEFASGVFPAIQAGALAALTLSTAAAAGCPEATVTAYEMSVRLNSRVLSGLAQPVVPLLRAKIRQKFDRAFMVARKIGLILAEDARGAGAQLASYPKLSAADKAELERLLKRLPPLPQRCR